MVSRGLLLAISSYTINKRKRRRRKRRA